MEVKIRKILADLESVRENLLALSDDIWLSIDHNDSEALQQGVQFRLEYNARMAAFDNLSTELSALIQQYTDIHLEPTTATEETSKSSEENQKIVKELDTRKPHSLDEDFRYKRPYGFVLQGKGFTEVVTWRRTYELVCSVLAKKDRDLFSGLPENLNFMSSQGNRSFSRNPSDLRSPMELTEGIYAEANLSANSIRDCIRKLLKTFGIPGSEMTIYLREDRDAEGAGD